jgi:hypothetical protein
VHEAPKPGAYTIAGTTTTSSDDSAPPSSSLLATTGQATSASVLSLPRPYRARTISTPFLDVFSIPNLVCKISYESLLFAETKTIIEKATTTTATRNCVVVSFILIIVVIVIKADMKRVKRVVFFVSLFPSLFFSLSFLEKPRSPQRDAEEVHGRRDYREE